jgi:hypothetical protein
MSTRSTGRSTRSTGRLPLLLSAAPLALFGPAPVLVGLFVVPEGMWWVAGVAASRWLWSSGYTPPTHSSTLWMRSSAGRSWTWFGGAACLAPLGSVVAVAWLLGAWGVGGEGSVPSLASVCLLQYVMGPWPRSPWWGPLWPGLLASSYRPLRIVCRLVPHRPFPSALGFCSQLTG